MIPCRFFSRKRVLLGVIAVVGLKAYFLIYFLGINEKFISKIIPRKHVILFWTSFHLGFNKSIRLQPLQTWLAGCPSALCILTFNRSLLSIAKAVVILEEGWSQIRSFPPVRSPNQYFIFFVREPPPHLANREQLRSLTNYFNLTVSYRRDSDAE